MMNLFDRENFENVMNLFRETYMDPDEVGTKKWKAPIPTGNIDFSYNYREWQNNKRHIYELFGNRLKVKRKLDSKVLLTESIIRSELEEFLEEHSSEFNLLILALLNEVKPKEISENSLKEDVFILGKKMNKGWKITRCFQELERDEEKLQKQLELFSVLVQKLQIEGNVVLSIDPLDYYTMSASRSGWSSCHFPNSSYGSGGLAYMNDSSTIIAYVETENKIKSEAITEDGEEIEITMNNKIWRQIIDIDYTHSFAIGLSHYPRFTSIFGEEAMNLLKEILEEKEGFDYDISYEDGDSYCIEEVLRQNEDNYDYEIFYCDYTENNLNGMSVLTKKEIGGHSGLRDRCWEGLIDGIVVGAPVYCACGCGSIITDKEIFEEENY